MRHRSLGTPTHTHTHTHIWSNHIKTRRCPRISITYRIPADVKGLPRRPRRWTEARRITLHCLTLQPSLLCASYFSIPFRTISCPSLFIAFFPCKISPQLSSSSVTAFFMRPQFFHPTHTRYTFLTLAYLGA